MRWNPVNGPRRRRRWNRATWPVALLIASLMVYCSVARADYGDIAVQFDTPVAFDAIAHNSTLNRYYGYTGGNRFFTLSGAGATLNDEFFDTATFEEFRNRGVRGFVALDDTHFVALDAASNLSWFSVVPTEDLPLMQLDQIVGLRDFLQDNEEIESFDRADDGGFWFMIGRISNALGAPGRFNVIFKTPASAQSIQEIHDLNALREAYDDGTFSIAGALKIDQFTGRPIIAARSDAQYFDLVEQSLLSRFPIAGGDDDPRNYAGVGGGIALLIPPVFPTPPMIRVYEVGQAVVPTFAGQPAYDQEGVAWTACSGTILLTQLWSVLIPIDWGDGGPDTNNFPFSGVHGTRVRRITPTGGAADISVVGGGATMVAGGIMLSLDPSEFHNVMNTANENRIEIRINPVNGADQIGKPIHLALDWQAYTGQVGAPCGQFSVTETGEVIRWEAIASFPPSPMTAVVQVPENPFFLGGQTFGIEEFQVNGELSFQSKGTGQLGASGGGGFLLGPGLIRMTGGAAALPELTWQGVEMTGGKMFFDVRGSIKDQIGWTEAFPALVGLIGVLPRGASILNWLDERAQLFAEIGLSGSPSLALIRKAPGPDLGFQGEFALTMDLKAGTNVELLDMFAEAQAFGQGAAQTIWEANAQTDYSPALKEMTLTALMQAEITTWILKRTISKIWQLKYEPGAGFTINRAVEDASRKSPAKEQWEYTYGRGGPGGKPAGAAIPVLLNANPFAARPSLQGVAADVNTELDVLGEISTDSQPVVAAGPGDTLMIVWSQEIAGRQPTQATDLYYSYYDGATFTEPRPVNTDTNADFSPRVAYHKSGKWIALWTRVKEPDVPATGDPVVDFDAVTTRFVPAWSLYDPATDTWTPVELLFDEPLCVRPKLATGPTHDITAFFVKNLDDRLITEDIPTGPDGRVGSPSRIYYSRFDNGTFEPAIQSLSAKFIEVTACDTGDEIFFGYTHLSSSGSEITVNPFRANMLLDVYRANRADTIPILSFLKLGQTDTVASPRLFAMTDGSVRMTWVSTRYHPTAPNQRFALMVTDNLAQYTTDHRILIADLVERNTQALSLSNPRRWSESRWDRAVPGEASDGTFYVAFNDTSNGRPNLKIVYDDPDGVPSQEGALLDDDAMEKRLNVVGTRGDELLLAYLKMPLTVEPVQVDVGGEMIGVDAVNVDPSGKLVLLTHKLTRDLEATPVRLTGGVLMAGHPVRLAFEVRNQGDLTITSPTVSIYARRIDAAPGPLAVGDPILVAADVEIADGILEGFGERTLEIDWTPGEDGSYEAWVVVDPANIVPEHDETNNQTAPARLREIRLFESRQLAEQLIGKRSLPEPLQTQADMNEDGNVDVGDVVQLVIEERIDSGF